MELLYVENLCKNYDKFKLDNVSFSLEKGYIMGFIGRNGAGKTTTLKSMLNLVHKDGGTVRIAGEDFDRSELFCKSKLGVVFGDVDYYHKKRVKSITDVVRRFYSEWDDAAYERYLKRFQIDSDKRIDQLSRGMKVKYQLALALSHNARLLLLDEPTSGLDPVSRDDILEVFQEIIEDGEHSIFFSTHITSDLEKCADYITYIKDGKIAASQEKDAFLNEYSEVKGTKAQLTGVLKNRLIGLKENSFGFSALMKTSDISREDNLQIFPADIETIMIHFERD